MIWKSNALLIFFQILSSYTFAATFCSQDFSLLALTSSGNKSVFWVEEKVGGDCYYSQIIQVILSNKTEMVLKTPLKNYENNDFFHKMAKRIETEPYSKFNKGISIWSLKNLKVKQSPPNKTLLGKFLTMAPYAKEWNKKMGLNGIQQPTFYGLKEKLMYYYPEGLYINYEISDIYLFENKRYLLVFTNQENSGVGNDTVHGFLIFKISVLPDGKWENSFHKYLSTQPMTAPDGFIVKSAPYLQANTLKETYIFGTLHVIGYLETDEGRFYMSNWSWKRAKNGQKPNWLWIKK